MFGLNYNKVWGEIHFWLLFISVNIIFLPMHFLGLNGMPRRIPQYPDAFIGWNYISSIGSAISVISVFVALNSIFIQLKDGNNVSKDGSVSIHESITPDFIESNNTREYRNTDIEFRLSTPPMYHSFNELPILSN